MCAKDTRNREDRKSGIEGTEAKVNFTFLERFKIMPSFKIRPENH